MCGRRSGISLLLSALLLALLAPFSLGEDLEVPEVDLPPGWYLIHETELTTLEENSETIGVLTTSLRAMFGTVLTKVNDWQTESTERTTRIEASLNESEDAVADLEARNRAITTELWVYRIGGVALVIAVAAVAFAPP